jgi:hypothetical protein
MCNVDTAVLGQVWADEQKPFPFPDFNTNHKCKNYDDIRIWAKKLQVRLGRVYVMVFGTDRSPETTQR